MRNLKKRGQISVFIILGILIAVVIIFVFRTNFVIKQVTPVDVEPINEHVENCIREKGFEGIEKLEKQGGRIYLDDGLLMYQTGDTKIAYWYDDFINIPSMSDMEKDLEEYVEDNLDDCLNFKKFDDYFVDVTDDVKVKVTISDKVNFDVEYPLDVWRNDRVYKISDFSLEIESELNDLYELSKKIMKKENDDLFLEEKTLDLLTLYGVPLSGASLDCEDKIWLKSELKDKVKNILAGGLPFVRVEKTKGEKYKDEMKMFVWDVTNEYYDMDVNLLFFQNWPFEFEVWPSKGEIVKGDVFRKVIPWLGVLCNTYYHFVYDLEFPAVFKVKKGDEEFYFATKVKIVANKARENDNVFNSENEEFCNAPGKKIKINDDFDVNFICGDFLCSKEVENGYVEVPVCNNGVIIASKDGYLSESKEIDTYEEDSVSFTLEKLEKMQFKVKNQNNIEIDKDKYMVVVHLRSDKFEDSVVYPEMDEIELVDGKYDVSLMLIKKDKLKIPGKTIEYCEPSIGNIITGVLLSIMGGTCEKKELVIPPMELPNVVVGGAEYIHSFTEEDLKKDGLIFYVYEVEVKSTDDMIRVMEKMKEYGEKVKKVEVK